MSLPVEAGNVRAVWSALLEVAQLDDCQVLARSESVLSPKGWLGLLALDGTLTAVVADDDQARAVRGVLAGLTPAEATTPEVIASRFGGANGVLGPAALFYPTAPLRSSPGEMLAERAGRDQLDQLLQDVDIEDADESGLGEITGSAFVARQGQAVVAACGWRAWPGGIAHLCVLTHPSHRREGFARVVAAQAIRQRGRRTT